ncbi:hypothetical protein F3G55_21000, partial [Klebsiella pneumoniae]
RRIWGLPNPAEVSLAPVPGTPIPEELVTIIYTLNIGCFYQLADLVYNGVFEVLPWLQSPSAVPPVPLLKA